MAQNIEVLKQNGTTVGEIVKLDLNQVIGIRNPVITRRISDMLNAGSILTTLNDMDEADKFWSTLIAYIVLDKVNTEIVDHRLIDFTIETEADIITKTPVMMEVLYNNWRELANLSMYREWLLVQLGLKAYTIIIGSTLPSFDLAICSNIIMELNMVIGFEYYGQIYLEVV